MSKSIAVICLFVLPFIGMGQPIKALGLNVGSAFGTTEITYASGATKTLLNYGGHSVSTFIEFISHENINLGVVAGLIDNYSASEEITLRKPGEGIYSAYQNYLGVRVKGRIKVSNSLRAFAIVEPYITLQRGFYGGELSLFQYYTNHQRFGAAYGIGIEQGMKRVSLSYNILIQQLFKDDYNQATEEYSARNIEQIDVASVVARIDIKYKLFLPK